MAFWLSKFPDDVLPVEMLSALEQAIEGSGQALERLEFDNQCLLSHIEDKMESATQDFRPYYAAFACYAAVATFLYDLEPPQIVDGEVKIDPNLWDASFYSSIAESECALWDGTGNATARREFWSWYFEVAIPSAWQKYA